MNRTEIYIKDFYLSLGINNASQLNINYVSKMLGLDVVFWTYTSEVARFGERYKMFINKTLSMQQRWQDFGHEMYHYFNDHTSYNTLHSIYYFYGECKADYFAYHFCVPTFMLLQLKEVSVDVITRLFNVEYDFALRRFEMYQNKMLIGGVYQHG